MKIPLKEERERLGFSQSALARELRVSREMIRQYELGNSLPGADVLAGLASLGFDTQFLLTGVRSVNVPAAEEKGQYKVEKEKGVGALSREEETLVELFRQLKPPDRTHAKAVVSALASKSEMKKSTGKEK